MVPSLFFSAQNKMASCSGVIDSFAVGQISELLSKTRPRKKDGDTNSGLKDLFSSSPAVQPVFVPVLEKKKKRKADDEKITEEEPKTKKKKTKSRSLKAEEHGNENKPYTKKISQEDPERLGRTVFIGNVPVTLTKKALQKMFDKYGAIESVRFRSAALAKPSLSKKVGMKRKEYHQDRHTLNGYIVFKRKNDAVAALESNGEEIEGVHIRVDLAKKDKDHDHSRSIFVGNLPFGIEEEQLREVFKDCGDIESVRLVRDNKTGIGKGFGFVLFKEKDAVSFALKLKQPKFNDRPIRVFPSSERPKKGHPSKVKKGKPPTHSFSGAQAKKNVKLNITKNTKRKDKSGNKSGKKKSKVRITKRSVAYKQAQINKRKEKK